MFKNILQNRKKNPNRQKSGDFILVQSNKYLSSIQKELSKQIDERYVQTFYNLFIAILMFRNRPMGLLLSELGGYIAGFKSAPAGTKRIGRLLGCEKWTHNSVDNFFFNRGKQRIEDFTTNSKRPLLLWDDLDRVSLALRAKEFTQQVINGQELCCLLWEKFPLFSI